MDEVVIRATDNGPYLVSGPITLIGPDGQEVDLSEREKVALCRCGGSSTKPFCDGTHSGIGFAAAEKAREEFDAAKAIGETES